MRLEELIPGEAYNVTVALHSIEMPLAGCTFQVPK